MTNVTISTAKAPSAIGPYSQAVACENTIFVSGQLPIDSNGEIPEGIRRQTRQVLCNIDAILHAGGMSLTDVVKTTVFLDNLDDFPEMNTVYTTFFEGPVKPARSAVEVAKVPKGARIEMEVIARK